MSLDDAQNSNTEVLTENFDGKLWYLKREDPPAFRKVLPGLASAYEHFAEDEWQSVQHTLQNPSQEPRKD